MQAVSVRQIPAAPAAPGFPFIMMRYAWPSGLSRLASVFCNNEDSRFRHAMDNQVQTYEKYDE